MNNKVVDFIQWMKVESFELSPKVSIINNPSSNYGLFSTDDIELDEVIFSIPRKSILSIQNSALFELLVKEDLIKKSKWANLILCILHELFLGESSHWNCYLSLFPNFQNLQLPLFWKNEDKILLTQADLLATIESDNVAITRDFDEIVLPFIKKYPNYFAENIDMDKYKYCVAFVMSYSFTEPHDVDEENDEDEAQNESDIIPYMVPMADVLNHKSFNNAHLTFEKDKLLMLATKPIGKGEEVLNTYGELSNSQLLHMYGFTLSHDENKNDVVELSLTDLKESDSSKNLIERIKKISNFGSELLSVDIGKNGFLNTQELAMVLYALNMQDMDFEAWCEEMSSGDAWEEEIEDVEMMADNLDSFETVKNVPIKWRTMLRALICNALNNKKLVLEDVRPKVNGDEPCPALFVERLLASHVQLLENGLRIVS